MRRLVGAPRGVRGFLVLAIAAAAAVFVVGGSSTAARAAHRMTPAVGTNPQIFGPLKAKSGTVDQFDCQSYPIDGSGPDGRCYSPGQIQQAYGYSSLLASGVDGSGQTIVIVDAYSNPYVPKDLEIQDRTFGLPKANYSVIAPAGKPPKFDLNDPNQIPWAFEITLDVLWAHAMAPGAQILLVEAKSSSDADMLAATKYAVDHDLGNVISQSFGEAESCADPAFLAQEHQVFQQAVNEGISLFASSGDVGAAQYSCDGSSAILSTSSPASDPLVTGVGGTTLNATDPAGNYLGETAWTEVFTCDDFVVFVDPSDVGCSGGGYSTAYGLPSFQQGLAQAGSGRGVPDVSYDAGLNGGVLIHCGACNVLFGFKPEDPLFFTIGGTSAGSPQWAALAADADQLGGHPLGGLNPLLYQLAGQPSSYAAGFHDITLGNNDVAELGGLGYSAGTGWDPVTGLGTPNAAGLLPALASACFGGTVNGDVTVAPGQTLCLLPGAHITHDLVVQPGGALVDTGAAIGHDLRANGATSVSIAGGSVGHDLSVQNSTGAVSITGVTIGHDLNVNHNAGPTTVSGNTVGGKTNIH